MRFIFWVIFFNLFLLFVTAISSAPGWVFLSVGQGDAALNIGAGAAFLVDAGPTGETARSVSRRLSRRKYLDVVFISHPDKDHWGGLPEIIRRYDIGVVAFPATARPYPDIRLMPLELRSALSYAENKGSRLVALRAGSTVDFGDGEVSILGPDNSVTLKGDNNRSLILSFNDAVGRALFVGDIGRTGEKYLVKRYGSKLKADILKVSHHGSKSSSGADFLNAVSPKVSVISVGKNSYGHPSSEVVARLIGAGSKVFRTDVSGDVFLPSSGSCKGGVMSGLVAPRSECYTFSRKKR